MTDRPEAFMAVMVAFTHPATGDLILPVFVPEGPDWQERAATVAQIVGGLYLGMLAP